MRSSVVGPVVGGIVFLTLFFKLVGWIARKSTKGATRVALKGLLDDRTLCTVHVGNGKTFENVRLVGFIDASSGKGAIPYQLNGMAVLEHADGRRTLIQAKHIRMIEVNSKSA
jgi:hypothetical protein